MNTASLRTKVRAAIEPVLSAAGLDLEDVAVTAAGRRSVLRVVVDADDGVSLDDVAGISRTLSEALDATTLFPGAYVLEVSSPGVDRPLTEPRHWRRAAGRLVEARLRDGTSVAGRVRTADAEAVVLVVAGGERRFGYAELAPGRVQVEFRHPDERAGAEHQVEGAGL
ncbi:MAG: ribosome maturation factor RimP [Actinomycetota bacterium]|nr:ribosome maturation factor RimP [Actinomycetota bacterium]